MTLGILGDTEAAARPGHRPERPSPAPRHRQVSTEPEQYQIRFQPAARPAIASASRKQSPPPCWNSASPPSRSIRTG